MSTLINTIKARLSVLGMDLQDSSKDGDLYSLRLRDRINDIEYLGFATEHEGEDVSQFWHDVLDHKMPNALINSTFKPAGSASKIDEAAKPMPAIIILPSQDVDALYAEATKRGAYPARYQLWDKFTVLAFNTADSAAIRAYVQGQPPAIADNTAKIAPKAGKKRYLMAAAMLFAVIAIIADKYGVFEPTADPATYKVVSSQNFDDSSIPALYLRVLAQDRNERVRIAVAENRALPEDVLDILSRDTSSEVRDRIALHPLATAIIRSRVYPDISLAPCTVREKIYAGGSVSIDMLAAAGRGSDTCAKRGVAQNSTTSLDVLTALAKDDDVWVRAHAAQNIRQVVSFPNVYDIAIQNFSNEISQLVLDTAFQRELKQSGDAWQLHLRQVINGIFRKNIYDPLGMSEEAENPMSFEVFLADNANSNAYAKSVARTADNIVSDTMNAVTPYLEGIMGDDTSRNSTDTTFFNEEFIVNGVRQLEDLELY